MKKPPMSCQTLFSNFYVNSKGFRITLPRFDHKADSEFMKNIIYGQDNQRRRELMRQKAQLKAQAGMTGQEVLAKEEEKSGGEDEEEDAGER